MPYHEIRLSAAAYVTITIWIYQVWSFEKLNHNPTMYIVDDAEWQRDYDIVLEREEAA